MKATQAPADDCEADAALGSLRRLEGLDFNVSTTREAETPLSYIPHMVPAVADAKASSAASGSSLDISVAQKVQRA